MKLLRTIITYVIQLAITFTLSYIAGIVLWTGFDEVVVRLVATDQHNNIIDLYYDARMDIWAAVVLLPAFVVLMRKQFLFWRRPNKVS